MIKYVTAQGDTADQIAQDQYGTLDGLVTEALLAANPGLAAMGPVLPVGVVVYLPALETSTTTEGVKLWS